MLITFRKHTKANIFLHTLVLLFMRPEATKTIISLLYCNYCIWLSGEAAGSPISGDNIILTSPVQFPGCWDMTGEKPFPTLSFCRYTFASSVCQFS